MFLSALGFALMAVFVKIAGNRGIPVLEIIAFRAAISLVISYTDVRRKGISPLGTQRWLLLARGAVGFVSLTGVYYGMVHLPLAEATVLQYLHPMFTALLALVLLRERPTAATLVCIVMSLAGLIVMVQPDFLFGRGSVDYDSLAVAIAVAGAFGSGLAYTIVRKLGASEDPSVIVMYFPLVCLPATVLLGGQDFVMPTGSTWLVLLMVGVFTQVGQVCLTLGMQLETASRATSFSYSQVVFAAILGIIVFGERPGPWTLVGAGMIILGALINLLWKRKLPVPVGH